MDGAFGDNSALTALNNKGTALPAANANAAPAAGKVSTDPTAVLSSIAARRKEAEGERAALQTKAEREFGAMRTERDANKPPEMTPLPPKPEPKFRTPAEAFGSPAGILAAFAGLLTRRPLINSLNAASGVMGALKAQDEAAFHASFEEWKANTENAFKMHDYEMGLYDAIERKTNMNHQERMAEMAAAAASVDNKQMQLTAERGDEEALVKMKGELQAQGERARMGALQFQERSLEINLMHQAVKELGPNASAADKLAAMKGAVKQETWDQLKVDLAKKQAMAIAQKNGRPTPNADDQTEALAVVEKAASKPVAEAAPIEPSMIKSSGAAIAHGMPPAQAIPGWGSASAQDRRKAIQEAFNQIKAEPGHEKWTDEQAGTEFAARQVDYASSRSSQMQQQKMLASTEVAVKQLDYNIDQVSQELKKLPSTDLSPVLNAIARQEQEWTGAPELKALFYNMNAAALESARILQGATATVQQLHEGAAKEAQKWANVRMTPAQWDRIAQAMKGETAARVQAQRQILEETRIGASETSGQEAAGWSIEPDSGSR